MCKWHGGTWRGTEIQRINGRLYNIDKCIAPIVKALNMCGLETVASCCGHGRRPGNIALKDGREIIIAPDYETGRFVDKAFPPLDKKGSHSLPCFTNKTGPHKPPLIRDKDGKPIEIYS